jgi:hypothetical protein
MGLPQILINFTKDAVSAIKRSENGIVCIVVKDDTNTSFATQTYLYSTDVKSEDYTAENLTAIQSAFLGTPLKVIVVRIATTETFSDATTILNTLKYNWLCFVDNSDGEQQAVATYIISKNQNSKNYKYKAIVFNATTTDNMHVVNFTNTTVTRVGETAISGYLYLPRLAGMLAGLPFTRSSTYYVLTDLESVAEPADVNAAIDDGEFILFNDDGEVRVARGVNSLVTLTSGVSADMKKITIVEAMDLILADISTEFKNNYVGHYKNNYDNQSLFISAINSYFKSLAKEDILDNSYSNAATIDIEAQRDAWLATGETEAAEWDDAKVKDMTFQSNVYLAGDIKILDAIEDLTFNITMA